MNRRVPNKNVKRYTIVGDGKVAQHFCHYFTLINVEHNTWSRKQSIASLKSKILKTDIVLLLISDSAIESFIDKNSFLTETKLVHFSGTLTLDNVSGCHPLMTFSKHLYELNTYESIPFICDKAVDFHQLFPQLNKNRWFNINQKDKAFYHAMCVMAGNFTQTLMRETSKELSNSIDLPENILFPYLLQNTKNFIADPINSITGPIQRGDFTTVKKHLHSLKFHPLAHVYQSFVKLDSIQTLNLKSENRYLNQSLKTNIEAAQ
ncbi:MAG: DUF2520 domain-containing protein [Marinicellaceae bacterium]